MSAPTVQAKFRVIAVVPAQSSDPNFLATTVTMVPVWEQDGVNRNWSKATPSGKLEMLITNPEAFNQFEPGKTFTLNFIPDD